jgi:hypothetical protein
MRVASLMLLVLLLAGCGPKHMIAKEPCPDVSGVVPPQGKAALVVGRTTIFGSGINFENYLDKKFIGTTKGHSFFVATVPPGKHYVIANGENFASLLINFEPDKTYYVQNEVRMGAFIARVKLDFVDLKHMQDDMGGTCKFYEIDPNEKVDDLTDEEFKSAIEDAGSTPINGIEKPVSPKSQTQ